MRFSNSLKLQAMLLLLFLLTAIAPAVAQDLRQQEPNDRQEDSTAHPKREGEEQLRKPNEQTTPDKSTAASTELKELESPQSSRSNGADVIIDGKNLFTVGTRLGPFSPAVRAKAIKERLIKLASMSNYDPGSMHLMNGDYACDISSDGKVIMSVSDADARFAGANNRQSLAQQYERLLKDALVEYKRAHSFRSFVHGVLLTAISSLGLALLLAFSSWIFNYLGEAVHKLRGTYIRSLKFQRATLLSEDAIIELAAELFQLLRIITVVALLMIYGTLVLSYFPDTRELSGQLVDYMLGPVVSVVIPAIRSYLPNLAFIAVIVFIARYFIKCAAFLFSEIEKGNITFSRFDQEWAQPTFGLVRFLLICFAFALIFPYLPGSGSPAFNQISLFVGVLISLGSSGAISHIVAGVFLIYTGAFKIGDRVRIADTTGDIVEKGLLSTRIRTIKNEYITVPNGLILSSHIINYSVSAGDTGLILHTSVTIGYDTPWQKVHSLLIEAALATEDIVSEPPPFVLQVNLDAFFVQYEINAYTRKPHAMVNIYSTLHQNIQNSFNQAGVEIMSPHYTSLRDGNTTTVPPAHRTTHYKPAPFGVKVASGEP